MGIFTRILGLFTQEAIPEAAADYYDLFAGRIVPTLYSGFMDAVARELRCGKILDVGTGPGYVPIEIAKRNEEVFVDGIDLTRKFREIGERNARNAGVSARVHFETGDATKMPFDDNSYDVVISTGAMHHWKYPARVIDEMYRVLKPGGEAWVLDPNKECSSEEWEEFLEKIVRLSGAGFFGRLWLRYGVRWEIKWNCYSRARIEEMARASSFGGCDIEIDGVYMTIKMRKK
ncbi:MAG TPA: class I SAM-dependent methyltransferase [Candidatus Avalokitesvara rifleensis]|uniref:class I SAM-dependent methyltransferase n=1 Tax=Candidatus Avalokitesvara rifleensis TaxID=3367620 RepID=UPI002712550C|nr:class I SAM-dependent methyltransferase [Candidatus Brocadiales bacterium]